MNIIPFIKRFMGQLKKENTEKAAKLPSNFQGSTWAASGRTELMQNRHAVRMKTFNTKTDR